MKNNFSESIYSYYGEKYSDMRNFQFQSRDIQLLYKNLPEEIGKALKLSFLKGLKRGRS